MGRRPTVPIPPGMQEEFYDCLWHVAACGGWRSADGRREVRNLEKRTAKRWMRRRHALVCLWLTALAARFSEVRRLRMSDIALGSGSAFVHRSKGGASGDVELSRELIHLTLDWRSHRTEVFNSPYVLPSRTGGALDVDSFNRDAAKFFGELFGIRLSSHCFRDTACQMAMDQSGKVRVVQSLMGHRSARTTEHYLAKLRVKAFQLSLFRPVRVTEGESEAEAVA
ncbi:tyrosine-type recombinase/integrase [Crateriforma conspicua]|uniref:Tyrosine recombinase n=1 Tax=Crateriforma conspicua TaxID=2527996 RepID=A0A5C6FVU1_9PLAN|nr:site-specific integrase [Crateriforma conspicua]TWU66476.1 tyrosine recombinase [Crateriforma conspicua]